MVLHSAVSVEDMGHQVVRIDDLDNFGGVGGLRCCEDDEFVVLRQLFDEVLGSLSDVQVAWKCRVF